MNSSYSIKPIETFYNGIHFRSRLEARWSFFFDGLSIKHYYEHEGYEITTDTKTIKYLPDFYIPKQNGMISVSSDMFFEIKPTRDLTPFEEEKHEAFSNTLSDNTTFGVLREMPRGGFFNDLTGFEHFLIYDKGGYDMYHTLCLCPFCWTLGYEFEGKWERISCSCGDAKKKLTPSKQSLDQIEKLLNTYARAASSQRFGT
jgi:hypothetical protein